MNFKNNVLIEKNYTICLTYSVRRSNSVKNISLTSLELLVQGQFLITVNKFKIESAK